MKFVATVRPPAHPEEAAKALAVAAGLTVAEARMRLSPEPPALLARLEAGAALRLTATLRESEVAALAVDVEVPTDRDRTVARTVVFSEASITFGTRSGDRLEIPPASVVAILRGLRVSRTESSRTEKATRFSVGTAIATGGLKMTRTSATVARSTEEKAEQVILVYALDGRAALLAEHELDFSCLGPAMKPSSTANMVELARRVREAARGAFYDERLLRLGRRSLPLLAVGESRIQTGTTVLTRTDTGSSLDVLAEVMRQALTEGLLP